MSMDERMTICNMSIEGGARVGYVNPDQVDVRLPARPPLRAAGGGLRRARARGGAAWPPIPARSYDDEVEIDAASIRPTVTWGINPGQSVYVDEPLPTPGDAEGADRAGDRRGARLHGVRGRAAASAARGSTSRSSARARTRGCRTCARRRGWSRPSRRAARARAGRAGLAAGPAGGRARRARSRSSSTPASTGAAPAARCAWR